MIQEVSDKSQLFIEIDKAVSQLLHMMSVLDNDKVNSIPFKDSWTPAQLLRHVSKSTQAMAKAMYNPAKPADRDPGERAEGLKQVFLDFSKKLNSPDFIIPEAGSYEKQLITTEVESSFELLKKNAGQANLNELVEGLPLGPITKLEILHFVLYHTQRHLNQMKRICEALK